MNDCRIHQSGVSRQLRILQEAGFVSMRPDQQRRLYSRAAAGRIRSHSLRLVILNRERCALSSRVGRFSAESSHADARKAVPDYRWVKC